MYAGVAAMGKGRGRGRGTPKRTPVIAFGSTVSTKTQARKMNSTQEHAMKTPEMQSIAREIGSSSRDTGVSKKLNLSGSPSNYQLA